MTERKGCFWCAKLKTCDFIYDKTRESIKKYLSERNVFGHLCSCFVENNKKEKVEFT